MRKRRIPKFDKTCLIFIAIAALSILMLTMPYISGEKSAVPATFFSGGLNIFSIIMIVAKILPAAIIILITFLPIEIIKKYVAIVVPALWLLAGEIVATLIMMQQYSGMLSIGFFLSVILALGAVVCPVVFTKKSKLPEDYKELAWYSGLSKIITIVTIPLSLMLTLSLILFADVFFGMSLNIVIGVILLWISLIFCAVISVFTLFERYKTGLLYYFVAFLFVAGIVSLFISANILKVVIGVLLACVMGFFWLYMAKIVRKHY